MTLAVSLSVTGCVNDGTKQKVAFCDVATPILIEKSDILSPETAKEILSHNLTGRELCKW
nr:MAG TPA: Protein of unknown function (DUF3053) [Caudoviricetes sp.]